MIKKLSEDLKQTNQRLDEIRIVSIEEMEYKLSKQVRMRKLFFLSSNFLLV